MERFKVLEKEMKIKAYSKEGLSQAAKLDPREQEKLNAAHWINQAVDKLGTQTDALEAELEALQIQARKSKRLDGDRQERLEVLPEMIERHKMHVRKLEQLLRLMENDRVGPDGVNGIKDDVEYYVEANQEPDFVPDEDLYEQFELADESSSDSEGDEEDKEGEGERDREKDKDKDKEKEREKEKDGEREESASSPARASSKIGAESGTGHGQSPTPGGSSPPSEPGTIVIAAASGSKEQVTPRRKSSITVPPPPSVTSGANVGKSKGPSSIASTGRAAATATVTTTVSTTGTVSSSAISMPVVLPPAQASPVVTSTAPSVAPPPVSKVTGPSFASAIAGALSGVGGSGKGGGAASTVTAATVSIPRSQSPPSSVRSTGPTTFSSAAAAAALSPSMATPSSMHMTSGGPPGMHNVSDAGTMMTSSLPLLSPIAVPGPYEEFYAVLMKRKSESQPSKGAASPLSRGARDLMAALEVSWQFCPDGSETERSRTFTPKQPFSVPSYYPNSPPAILENPSIFERFELDTLFFIFYYQQRTYAQYFAARELKRQSWRFHKKYLTWFQRHEEPKTITEEFEQGTYIYFDYEGNWCQRKKSEFTFEYRYLEDEETI